MANHKSAIKRSRQNIKRRDNNRWKISRVRTEIKKFRIAITENKVDTAKVLLVKIQSLYDKLAKSPAMTKQTASRRVGRLASQVAKL